VGTAPWQLEAGEHRHQHGKDDAGHDQPQRALQPPGCRPPGEWLQPRTLQRQQRHRSAVMCHRNTVRITELIAITAIHGPRRRSHLAMAGASSVATPVWKTASAATPAVVGNIWLRS
jgi:hypothetical protein